MREETNLEILEFGGFIGSHTDQAAGKDYMIELSFYKVRVSGDIEIDPEDTQKMLAWVGMEEIDLEKSGKLTLRHLIENDLLLGETGGVNIDESLEIASGIKVVLIPEFFKK